MEQPAAASTKAGRPTPTIIITRNGARNDIEVNGIRVSLSGPGRNKEARKWLLTELYPDQPLPGVLASGETGGSTRKRKQRKGPPRNRRPSQRNPDQARG